MSNIYKTEAIFKNRDILFEAVQQESVNLKKDLLTGNKTLKIFSRVGFNKKDISATEKNDLEYLIVNKFTDAEQLYLEEEAKYKKSVDELQSLVKIVDIEGADEIDSNANYLKKAKKRKFNRRAMLNGSEESEGKDAQTLLWNKWSGNGSQVPVHLRKFLVEDDDDVDGPLADSIETISIPFKSTLWQQITKNISQPASQQGNVRFNEESLQSPSGVKLNNRQDDTTSHVASESIKRHCPSSRRYNSLSVLDFISSLPVFQYLSLVTLKAIEAIVKQETFSEDQPIVMQGQVIANLYIVRKGMVRVERSANVRASQLPDEIQVLFGGDVFGYDLNADFSPAGASAAPGSSGRSHSDSNASAGGSGSSSNSSEYELPNEEERDEGVPPPPPANLSPYTFCAASERGADLLTIPLEALIGIIQQDRNYIASISCKMALFCQSNAYPAGMDYISLTTHTQLFKDILPLLESPSLVDAGKYNAKTSGGKVLTQEQVQHYLMKVNHLCNPELDFEEIVDELLHVIKTVLQVDRVSIYLIDKVQSTMVLFSSSSAGASNKEAPDVATAGVRMPLKGLAAYVALHNVCLNIPDCYNNKNFDPAMDIRTGYRTQQMLCCPIHDNARTTESNVVAVLQCINTLNKQTFGAHHLAICNIITAMLSTKHYLLKLRSSASIFKSVTKMPVDSAVQFTIASLVTDAPHRHIKLAIRLMTGNGSSSRMIGKPVMTELFNTYELANNLKQCDIDTVIEFHQLNGEPVRYSQLSANSKVIIQLFSKNNHAAGWCGVQLFQFNRVLNSNIVNVTLWDGLYPSTNTTGVGTILGFIPVRLEGFDFMRTTYDGVIRSSVASNTSSSGSSSFNFTASSGYNSNHTVINNNSISLEMMESDVNVLYESTDTTIRYSFPLSTANALVSSSSNNKRGRGSAPAPLAPGVKALDWYLKHMTDSERRLVTNWLYTYDIIDPLHLEPELITLLWRIRMSVTHDNPHCLHLLLSCIDYTDNHMIADAYRLLNACATPPYFDVIQLLDSRFCDYKIRHYAVSVLRHISDLQLFYILFTLVYMLRYEPFIDNALTRFLLQRGIANPYGIGQQLLYYLNYCFQVEAIYCHQYSVIAQLLLRGWTDEQRIRICQGSFLVNLIHSTFNKAKTSPSIVAMQQQQSSRNRTPTAADNVARAKSVLNLFVQEMATYALLMPSEFVLPLPTFMDASSGSQLRQDQPPPAQLCSQILTWNTVDDRKHSFMFSMKTNASSSQNILYTQDLDCLLEVFYHQLLQILDTVWSNESDLVSSTDGVTSAFHSAVYNAYAIVDNNSTTNTLLIDTPKNSSALQSLIIQALYAEFVAAKEAQQARKAKGGKGGSSAADAAGPKKIPENLVERYLKNIEKDEKLAIDASVYAKIKRNFVRSLIAYLLSSHVLGVSGVNVSNTELTRGGDVYVKHPPFVLAMESSFHAAAKRPGEKRPSAPPFFLPCFSRLLENADEEREFYQMTTTAFLALRKHCAYIVYAVTSLCKQLKISDEMCKDHLAMLKENLMLNLTDAAATNKLNDLFNRGLKADYQLNVSFG